MSPTTLGSIDGRYNILDEPEDAGLLRLTGLTEHVFRVPIAYIALLGPDLAVVSRVGSGERHWKNLKTYPLTAALEEPVVWPDTSVAPPTDFICGELRFVASAPLRSSSGLELGLLVIADTQPKPEFSKRDHEILEELAGVLAGKMELRVMALHARETECSLQEAEYRFRNIANCAPVMIIYAGVEGGTSFVNKRYLEFTGRTLPEELGDGYADTIHPDHRQRVTETYLDAFQGRRPVTIEFPMRRHDGEYRWIEARGTPRISEDGRCAGYIGCFIDLTGTAIRPTPALISAPQPILDPAG